MPLAYYSVNTAEDFWTEHWGRQSVADLLAVARRSPLTRLIVDALPPPEQGAVLEAGSGLGQYVILLRERGWRAIGADASGEALATCRLTAPVPLMQVELGRLPVHDRAFAAYVSLGVVEHDPEGPDRIVAEAARVLTPGGVLLLSVPYWNGVRRAGAPWVRRQSRAIAGSGGRFYQFAFSRAELASVIARHGFELTAMHPYDPGRLLRRWLPRAKRGGASSGGADAVTSTGDALDRAARARSRANGREGGGVRGALASLLYAPPVLRLLAHMILAVAVRR